MAGATKLGLEPSELWFCGIRIEQMSNIRFASHVTVDALLHFTIRFRLALVLTKVFVPRMHQENLKKAIGCFGVAIDSPLIRTIATPRPGIFADRLNELCLRS